MRYSKLLVGHNNILKRRIFVKLFLNGAVPYEIKRISEIFLLYLYF
jgi:hypothetical protein